MPAISNFHKNTKGSHISTHGGKFGHEDKVLGKHGYFRLLDRAMFGTRCIQFCSAHISSIVWQRTSNMIILMTPLKLPFYQ